MMRRGSALLALAVAIGSTAGCAELTTTGVPADSAEGGSAGTATTAPLSDPLTGTSWTLVSSEGSGPDLTAHSVTATFEAGQLAGQAPVNTYTASYEAHGGQFSVGPVASTKMAGEPEAMAAEDAYFALLAEATGFEQSAEELVLTAEGQSLLTYHPAQGKGEGAMDQQAEATQEFADSLVGMPVADSEAAAKEAGLTIRVVAEDGEAKAVTTDYRTDRVNVEVEGGTVTKATVG